MRFCFFLLFLLLSTIDTRAQGCSDAGFCTMGAMRPDQTYNRNIQFKLRSVEVTFYRGKTTISPIVYSGTVDLTFGLNRLTSFQLKLPYQYVKGNLGSASGLSDISLSATRQVYETSRYIVNATFGIKIPTNDSNLKEGDQPLPMYYQVSLGSFDIVAGASLISDDWLVAAGYQNALTANGNQFAYADWPDYPDQSYLEQNALATDLKRGTDIMLRVERNVRFTNYNFSLGALPIYRITHDQIKNPEGEYYKVDGTTGMALSLLFGAGYQFNVNSSVKFIYGYKLLDRKVNPDGLTRDNVFTLSYVTRF